MYMFFRCMKFLTLVSFSLTACFGPAFNVKRAMICPNCRKVEDNEWKYSLDSGDDDDYLGIPISPQELGLNIGFDGGPLYGDDQANNPEGGNGSPLELDLNIIGFDGGLLYGEDQANNPGSPLELGLNIGIDGGPLYGDDQANNPSSPIELGLNIGFDGGPLYGDDQANNPGSPLEPGLNIGFDGSPLYGDDQANNPGSPLEPGLNIGFDGVPLYGDNPEGNGSPIELGLNIGFDGGSLCGDDQATIPADVCSICLENVVDDNSRGITKLQCGHFFHLSCIGPAINVKGAVICPNCRKVEENEWKYSVGSSIRNNDVSPTTPENEDSSDDDDMRIPLPYFLLQDGSPHASSIEVRGERMLASFTYSGATELPLFAYGGNDMPYIHYHQHTHVIPTDPGAGNTIGEPSSPPPISVFNSLGYFWHMGNGTGFGLGGSASAGTSADGAGIFAGDAGTSAGGMPSSPRNPFESLQPDYFGFPPDSTPPTMGQRLNRSGELDSLETPVAPGHNGGSLSASADPPPELGLNIDFDGGPFYGDDQANNPEGGNGSSPGIENIDPD